MIDYDALREALRDECYRVFDSIAIGHGGSKETDDVSYRAFIS